ncbi:MAG: chemotaxis protein CheW [Bacteroidales bacterium]|nr:chemotaxis protein CheW [Bacteroidales bacterium]
MPEEITTDDLESEEVELDQYLVFSARSQEFGFKAIWIREITVLSDITEVPYAPSYIEGVLNLRGQLVSVINFRKMFRFELIEYNEDTRVVILEHEGFPVGIIVDSVEEVIRIPDNKIQNIPESTTTSRSKDYITGVAILDNRLIIMLDVDKMLTKTEMIKIDDIKQTIENIQTMDKKEEA